jgi:DNA-binding YbaB/EbfC family protein
MGSGFSKQKKQARMIQDQLAQWQNSLQQTEVMGEAGNGLVKISLNGDGELLNIQIKKECVDVEDLEALEDLIKEAHKKATLQIKNLSVPGMPSLSSFGL